MELSHTDNDGSDLFWPKQESYPNSVECNISSKIQLIPNPFSLSSNVMHNRNQLNFIVSMKLIEMIWQLPEETEKRLFMSFFYLHNVNEEKKKNNNDFIVHIFIQRLSSALRKMVAFDDPFPFT